MLADGIETDSIAANDGVADIPEYFVIRQRCFFDQAVAATRQAGTHGIRNLVPDAPSAKYLLRIRKGCWVSGSRPAGNGARVVTQNIGKDQRIEGRRFRETCQSPALEVRKMLAYGIDLVNARATREQQLSGFTFVLERDR